MKLRDYLIIGLTGATGAGKSTAVEYFRQNGFVTIDADSLARKAMMPGSSCLKQVCGVFGKDILNPDNTLNRGKLAKKAFSSRENAQLLNDITHPWIFLQIMKLCREHIDSGNKKILFDAPLLFESRSEIMCDFVVCVTAPKEVRMERLLKRDGLSREQLEKRMKVQHEDNYYISKADFVIDGSASLENVKAQVDRICGDGRVKRG